MIYTANNEAYVFANNNYYKLKLNGVRLEPTKKEYSSLPKGAVVCTAEEAIKVLKKPNRHSVFNDKIEK